MSLVVWHLDPAQLTPYYNIAVCDALAEAGCTVRYFTSHYLYDASLPESAHVSRENIYFRGLGWRWLLRYPRVRRLLRGLSYPFGHLRLLREIQRQRPDIIHIQWSRVPRFDLWLIRRIQSLGIPVVHTVHDVVPLFAGTASVQPLTAVYTAVDAIILHTQANQADFYTHFPAIPAERSHLIPLIEFQDTATPADASQAQARQRLSLPPDAPIIGFFGSIRHYKGLDVLLAAFEIARQQNPALQLLIAGKIDPLEQDKVPRAETLRALHNVHFIEGYIPAQDVWLYHLAPDVLVLPYRHIYQSGALITAMGFGCPVIVTDVGGLPETIDGNGWVVPAQNPAALADALLDSVADRQRLTRMAARSRQLIAERHSKPAVAAAHIAVYQAVLSQ